MGSTGGSSGEEGNRVGSWCVVAGFRQVTKGWGEGNRIRFLGDKKYWCYLKTKQKENNSVVGG